MGSTLHQGQTGVTGKLLNDHMAGSDNASIGDLQKQIKELDKKYSILIVSITVLGSIIGTVLIIFTNLVLKSLA